MKCGPELGEAAAVGDRLQKWDTSPNDVQWFQRIPHALSWLRYDGVEVLPFHLFPFGMLSVETYNSTSQYDIKNIIQITMSGARG